MSRYISEVVVGIQKVFFSGKERTEGRLKSLGEQPIHQLPAEGGSFQLVADPTHIQGGKYQILDFLLTSLLISLLFIQVHWTMSTCNECLGYCGFRIG